MVNPENIVKHFQIPQRKYIFKTVSNGLINDTWFLLDQDLPVYVLQRINTDVFTNFESLSGNIEKILPLLNAPDYQKITLVHTHEGNAFYTSDDRNVWRIMTYVSGSKVFNTTDDPEIAFEAGRIIGKFHRLLQDFDTRTLGITLPRFHDVHFRHEQFKAALKNADTDKKELAKDAIGFVHEHIDTLLDITFDRLPVRVCHNDTKLNNILFSSENKALCLIDLDTLMPGSFLYDFGDAVRTLVNPAPEDETQLDKIQFNMELFEAFSQGLAQHKAIFSQGEIEQMPLGAPLMPFLHGIRALTDFLENNRYYKVQYETQNLDRCKSLFRFSQLAFDRMEDMRESIEKNLK